MKALLILIAFASITNASANAPNITTSTIRSTFTDTVVVIDRCEHLAEQIMNEVGDYDEETPDAKEMDSLECHEHGDFFN